MTAITKEFVVELARQGPVGILALLVWWELREFRQDVAPITEGIAIILDRTGGDTRESNRENK